MRTKYLMIVIAIPRPYRAFRTAQPRNGWWNAGVPAEEIKTGLREACMKRDQFKRLIALIQREHGYLTKVFLSRRFSLHERALSKNPSVFRRFTRFASFVIKSAPRDGCAFTNYGECHELHEFICHKIRVFSLNNSIVSHESLCMKARSTSFSSASAV